ncbi:MAG: FKBP-type peptidyl-prolyl cis-trans isomerase [Saprospiraceae bacterium]|nr:FKBP-type peptidyl-prolyl cis-trans isomerase [Saprospiraceae bacterium]
MNSFFTFIVGFIFLAGCGSGLKNQMVSNPSNQADKDKNAILEYAISKKMKPAMTESGIYYVIETEGDGQGNPAKTDLITAHYHGTLLDGSTFDSSVERGSPFEFQLGGVIKGWQESIPLLSKGGKGTFMIPSSLAYGTRGAGAKIPANSPLVFEIELIDFQDPVAVEKGRLAKQEAAIMDYAKTNNLTLEKTEKGVYYMIERKGTGTTHPDISSKVKVHYHGTLLDGTVFDSSVERGEPIEFGLNQVIPGWQDGIPVLTKGAKGKLIIPSSLGYGPRPAGKIPPHSVLVFDVELLDFK